MNLTIKPRTRSLRAGACAVALIAALATACSSASDTQQSAGGASGNAYVTRSQELLDLAQKSAITGPATGAISADKLAPWSAKDMPAPSTLTDKKVKVAVVTVYPVGFPTYGSALIKALAPKLGWSVETFNAATPDPQGAAAAMSQAILTKPDVIVALAVPSVYVASSLADAKAKGIPTIAVHSDAANSPGFDAFVPASEGVQKDLMAAWIVAKSGGKASVVATSSPPFGDANVPAAVAYLKECGGCKVKSVQFSPDVFTDQTKTPASLASAMSSSDISYVVYPNGSGSFQGALNGIKASRSPNAQLLLNNPGAPAIQALGDGQVPMVVQVPASLLVLTALDDVNRLVSGKAPLAGESLRMPVSYWTKDQAPKASLSSITAAQLKANDFVSVYEKAWGIPLKSVILGVEG